MAKVQGLRGAQFFIRPIHGVTPLDPRLLTKCHQQMLDIWKTKQIELHRCQAISLIELYKKKCMAKLHVPIAKYLQL